MTREEQLRLARQLLESGVLSEESANAIKADFPELKESEDERMRNAAIRACKYMVDNFENSTKDYADAIAWLEKQKEPKKALRMTGSFVDGSYKFDVVDMPKPAEWSEEDKKLLDFWLDVIDRNDWRMDENFCKASREFINRLKSLRPQSHWKPSEEQMEALKYSLGEGGRYDKAALASLYNDIKKL